MKRKNASKMEGQGVERQKSVRYNGRVPDGWHSLIENNLVALIGRDSLTRDQQRVPAFFPLNNTSYLCLLQYLL